MSKSVQALYTTLLKNRTRYRLLSKIAKSFFRFIGSICILVTICFFIMHTIPGDPFQDEHGLPHEIRSAIQHQWGLDQPLLTQFFCYIKQLLQGNLGYSIKYPSESVSQIILSGISTSVYLGMQALCIAIPVGVLLGTLSAKRANGFFDNLITASTALSLSIPNFVLASLLQLSLALMIPIFPVAGWNRFSHTFLPSIALAIGPICSITRLIRSSTLDVLTKDYVITAQMKGLSEFRLLFFHIIPNAFLPVLSYIGPTTTNLLVGSFAIERVFGIPGLGQWFVCGVISRDYPLIGGLTLFYSLVLFSVHFCFDLITTFIDPRIVQNEILV